MTQPDTGTFEREPDRELVGYRTPRYNTIDLDLGTTGTVHEKEVGGSNYVGFYLYGSGASPVLAVSVDDGPEFKCNAVALSNGGLGVMSNPTRHHRGLVLIRKIRITVVTGVAGVRMAMVWGDLQRQAADTD